MNSFVGKIGLYFNCQFCFDGEKLTCSEPFPLFWFNVFEDAEIILIAQLKSTHLTHDVPNIKNIKIISIQNADDVFSNQLMDCFISVIPNRLGRKLLRCSVKNDISSFGYVRGDHYRTVKYKYKAKWYRDAARLAAKVNEYLLKSWSRSLPCIYVGDALLKKYGNNDERHLSIYVNSVVMQNIIDKPRQLGKQIRLIYVGRFSEEKGVDRLKNYMAKTNWPLPVTLTLVGEGPLKSEVLRSLKELSDITIKDVEYISDTKDLNILLDKHEFFISLSRTEGLPKTFIEASARGLVVITTDVGSVSRVFTTAKGTILHENKDSVCLGSRVGELLTNYTARSSNAIQTARDYCFDHQKSKILEFIKANRL